VPRGSLPPDLATWLGEARPAVVSTLRPDGSPVTSATWYDLVDGRLLLTMHHDGPRHRNLLRDPRLSLTALGSDWYRQVTVAARAVEFRPDPDRADVDGLSQRYLGEPYRDHSYVPVTVLAAIEGWHAFGFDGV
jgi:PPOX class probable F420-dependent enzyme